MPTFSVYVIELDASVCDRTACPSRLSGKPHVYVGQTRKSPAERFAEHMAGGFTSARAVRHHGIRIREWLCRNWGPYRDTRRRARCRSKAGRETPGVGLLRQGWPLTPEKRVSSRTSALTGSPACRMSLEGEGERPAGSPSFMSEVGYGNRSLRRSRDVVLKPAALESRIWSATASSNPSTRFSSAVQRARVGVG